MLFKGSRVQHGSRSFLRADPRLVLGYHKEVHHHHTVIHEAKSDAPARVGMLVMAAYLAYEHREAIAEHGGRLVRAVGGALLGAGARARHRLSGGAEEARQIEEATIVASDPPDASGGGAEAAARPGAGRASEQRP